MISPEDLDIAIVIYDKFTYDCFNLVIDDNTPKIKVVNADIRNYYFNNQTNIDTLVSPGNSFGLMTGNYDAALSDILGWDFQDKVQQYIKDNFYGEQVVGSSFFIKTDIEGLSLIHTPTMRYPSKIVDVSLIYHCMRSTLICALKNDCKRIVVPAFGCQCGQVNPIDCAELMRRAYLQILNQSGPEYQF